MRIRIHFRAPPPIVLPLHYNYHLAALIYHLLACSSAEFAVFLHGQGYGEGDRRFKLFTFSQLLGGQRRIVGDRLQLGAERVHWYVTSPVDAFVLHFVDGLLGAGNVEVAGVPFAVEQVETLPEPKFTSEMRFTCLSPITMSVRAGGQRWAQYLSPEDPRFAAALLANLERKYALVQGLVSSPVQPPSRDAFSLTFDPDYIARRGGRVSKLIDYKGTKIRGYLAPFTAVGPPDFLRIGYQCGFGDKNSEGFGMVEVVKSHSHSETHP